MVNGPIGAVAIAAIRIVLFLLCRAIVLWYWRINEGIALLKISDEKLDRIAGNTPKTNGRTRSASGSTSGGGSHWHFDEHGRQNMPFGLSEKYQANPPNARA
jgi:hypothetical protein